MSPVRKFRIVIWPFFATAAVIGLLFVFEKRPLSELTDATRDSSFAHSDQPASQSPSQAIVQIGSAQDIEPLSLAEHAPLPIASNEPAWREESIERIESLDSQLKPAEINWAPAPPPLDVQQELLVDRPVVIETVDESLSDPSDRETDATGLAISLPDAPSVMLGAPVVTHDTTYMPEHLAASTHDIAMPEFALPSHARLSESSRSLNFTPEPRNPYDDVHFSSNRKHHAYAPTDLTVDLSGRAGTLSDPSFAPLDVQSFDPPEPEAYSHPESPSYATPEAAQPGDASEPNSLNTDRPIERSSTTLVETQWPQAPALMADLDGLQATDPTSAAWTDAVRDAVKQLQQEPRLGSEACGQITSDLQQLAQQGYQAGEAIDDLSLQRQWITVAYSVQRRADLWAAVWQNVHAADAGQRAPRPELDVNLAQVVAEIRSQIGNTQNAEDWQSFLLLNEFEAASVQHIDDDSRRRLAQRYLSRIEFTHLDDAQQRWLDSTSCSKLAQMIRAWAHGPVDYVALLDQIEVQQTDSLDRDGGRIASTMQTLRFANNRHAYKIAETINQHFRNANFRVAVSQTMLNRLLPDVPETTSQINDHVLGASVLGLSRAQADIRVQLEPSPDAWQIRFNSNGMINTQTWSHQGPASLNHVGAAEFHADTQVRIDRHSVTISDPNVDVDATNSLQRVRSQYDGFPVVGPLVREYILSRHDEMRGLAQRISENRIRQKVRDQLAQSLQTQLNQAQDKLSNRLIGPLSQLQLTPTVVDMATTDDRLTVRYRLAGDWQLAAFSPRPRAPASSLLSVQLHQSTLNNALERLVPQTQPTNIVDAIRQPMRVFGLDPSATIEDVRDDMEIQFTRTRPITVEVTEGRLWLTMRVVRLQQQDNSGLRNFIVRASYVPRVDGLRPELIRDGHLNISGPRLSIGDRVAIRTIFNKVLSPNRSLQLMGEQLQNHPAMDGLAVTQFELRDGWIGFAIGDQSTYVADTNLFTKPSVR